MSNDNAEDNFMKNLKANEKRKLMRHIENAQNNAKKTNNSANSSKGYSISPKPFSNAASKPLQSTKSLEQVGVASQSNVGSVTKPVLAPGQKSMSSNDFVMPQLNKDLVAMFNAKEANSSKFKPKDFPKKAAVSSETSNKSNELKNLANNRSKVTSSVTNTPSNFAKVNPISAAPSRSSSSSAASTNTNPIPPWKQDSNEKKGVLKPKEVVNSKDPIESKKSVQPVRQFVNKFEVNNVAKTKQESPAEHRRSSSNVKPVLKPSLPKSNQPQGASANPTKPVAKLQTPPIAASKPSSVVRPRAEPPLSEKHPQKVSPPTAVVSPVQDKSKEKVSSPENRTSAEAARLRSVSTPVPPPSQSNVATVAYNAVSDSVNLPQASPAPITPIPVVEAKKKRSMSEVSKGPLQINDHKKKGKKLGHDFQPHELKDWVNWCDACGSVILSLFGKCVACTKCKMVCHVKCALSVSLTCEADQSPRSLTLTDGALNFYKTIVRETTDESSLKEYNTIQRVITFEEVQEKIEEFNLTVKGSQQMTLQEDGETFRGFIRVTMNLTRPVSVIDSSSKTARKPTNHQRKASFYIDKGAMKALHLTSDTTAEQVVQALLLKYNISDNPMKFALFEKEVREEGHVILRKMLPKERPLFLRLLWGNGSSNKRGFTLQENESRDIHWESFSIAELYMFIKILDKEENDYILEIKRKYKHKAKDIKNAIDHQNKMATCS